MRRDNQVDRHAPSIIADLTHSGGICWSIHDDIQRVGIPRYLATAVTTDLDRTLWLADDLSARPEQDRVALVECGRPSPLAREVADLLARAGRTAVLARIENRDLAQSDVLLRRLSGVSSVWVFVENLFDAYMSVFATQLTFAMRRVARQGVPVIGVGAGAMALGGLLLAQRVCGRAQYDLVSGLGWAPRLLLDGGADRGIVDGAIARDAVCTLPGLLGVEVGTRGGVKVIGGRVESVGEEPILLLGSDAVGKLLSLELEPGQVINIAPPPFAPFTRDLLPTAVHNALNELPRPPSLERH
ncbi:MAG: hypothetical protein JO020_33995, partial [Chloroflexi bacterium]|nr:hypothetical protein [Chloroflexota bacterium]